MEDRTDENNCGGQISHFCTVTTFHGFYHAYKSKTFAGKAFWMAIIVLAFAGLFYVVVEIIRGYLSAPSATSIKAVVQNRMTFPDVLLCNKIPLNFHKLENANISFDLAFYAQHVFMMGLETFQRRYDPYMEETLDAEFQNVMKNMSNSDVRDLFFELGQSCEDFLVECQFGGKQFNCCEAAVEKFDPKYGKCFLIAKNFQQEWPTVGLTVLMKLNHSNNVQTYTTPSVGVAVRILPSYDATDFGETLLAADSHVAIELNEQRLLFENTVVGKTCDGGTNFKRRKSCQWFCVHQAAIKKCACSYAFARDAFGSDQSGAVCSPKMAFECIGNNSLELRKLAESCMNSCLPPCIIRQYIQRISTATLLPNDSRNWNLSQVLLDIYFDRFQVSIIRQVNTMTGVSVVANLGGAMGVFVGASLISVVELLAVALSKITNRKIHPSKEKPIQLNGQSNVS